MWTDGQTNMTKLTVAFPNFAKASKKDRYSAYFFKSDRTPDKENFYIICTYISEAYTNTHPTSQYSVYPFWCGVLHINEAGL
jgi:hypothetical protein